MSVQEPELERIVRDYSAMVQGALLRLGVQPHQLEDGAQEVFLVLSRRFEEYDAQRSLASWLWGIARGVASTHRRSLQRRHRLASSVASEPRPEEDSLDDVVARGQARDMLRRFLASLDEDKCAVFVLAEIEGCTGPEIAARLDVNLNTVYARLRAARRRFEVAVEARRHRAAVASAWFGLRWGAPQVATASLSTVMAAAVVVPSLNMVAEASRARVAQASESNAASDSLEARPDVHGSRGAPEQHAPSTLHTRETTVASALPPVPSVVVDRSPPKKSVPVRRDPPEAAAHPEDTAAHEYTFHGETFEARRLAPLGHDITGRVVVHHESLIQPRGDFISELVVMTTDL